MSTTLRQAAENWVATFDQVPGSIFEKLAKTDDDLHCYDCDTLRLVASPYLSCTGCGRLYDGELTYDELRERADDGQGVACSCDHDPGDGWERAFPEHFPCGWGTLFAPDPIDARWILEHAEQVAALSFFVFESEDWGCLLGIDAGGFDFFEELWIPLYELRGLEWHLS
jgi:hypothetical protein